MSKLFDLKNKVFGRLTVEFRLSDHITSGGNHVVFWQCRCVCGKQVGISANSLLQRKTKSCGCLSIEASKSTGLANKKHGGYSQHSDYSDRVKHQALVNIKERSRRNGYESGSHFRTYAKRRC